MCVRVPRCPLGWRLVIGAAEVGGSFWPGTIVSRLIARRKTQLFQQIPLKRRRTSQQCMFLVAYFDKIFNRLHTLTGCDISFESDFLSYCSFRRSFQIFIFYPFSSNSGPNKHVWIWVDQYTLFEIKTVPVRIITIKNRMSTSQSVTGSTCLVWQTQPFVYMGGNAAVLLCSVVCKRDFR